MYSPPPSQRFVREFGLGDRVEIFCADAAEAPDLGRFALAWVNDYGWSEDSYSHKDF